MCLFEFIFVCFQVSVDVLLQQLLVGSAHLRTERLDGLALVGSHLPTALLRAAHILRLCFARHHLLALVDLYDELAAVAQDQHPVDDRLAEDAERVEVAVLAVVLLDFLEDLALAPLQGDGVREVDQLGVHIVICRQEFELGLFFFALFLRLRQSINECLVERDGVSPVGDRDLWLILIHAPEFLHELVITTVLRKVTKQHLALAELEVRDRFVVEYSVRNVKQTRL